MSTLESGEIKQKKKQSFDRSLGPTDEYLHCISHEPQLINLKCFLKLELKISNC